MEIHPKKSKFENALQIQILSKYTSLVARNSRRSRRGRSQRLHRHQVLVEVGVADAQGELVQRVLDGLRVAATGAEQVALVDLLVQAAVDGLEENEEVVVVGEGLVVLEQGVAVE